MSKYLVDLTQELNAIRTTPYGKTMRPNLADAIEKLNKRHNALSETFDNLVIDAGNSNAEVVDARNDNISQPPVNHQTLGGRLDAMQQQISNTSNNVAPIIQEVEQARGPHNNLNDRLNGIDNKFNDYLPLTGGDITGDLEVNGNLTTGGHQVWHEGNLIPEVDAIPDTVVKRSATASVTTGQILNFQDNAQNRIGGITLDENTRELRHNHIPVGSNQQTAYDIWTKRNLHHSYGNWTPVVTGFNGGAPTYTTVNCQYERIGRLVHITGRINITNTGNMAGTYMISGLPFTCNGANEWGGYWSHLAGVSNSYIYPVIYGGQQYFRFRFMAIGGGAEFDVTPANGQEFGFTIIYITGQMP